MDDAPVPDLLGSILSGQSLLLMDSSDVTIHRDGSLSAKQAGEAAQRSQPTARFPTCRGPEAPWLSALAPEWLLSVKVLTVGFPSRKGQFPQLFCPISFPSEEALLSSQSPGSTEREG